MLSDIPTIPWTVDLGPAFAFAHTAADKRALKRATKAYPPQPQSLLLSLPPELRTLVYETVALETEAIALKSNRLTVPPLGRVCRQVEREYCDVYTALALKAARHVKLYSEDFAHKHIPQILENLPTMFEQPDCNPDQETAERTYTLLFHLTNEFPYHMQDLRNFKTKSLQWDPSSKFRYEVKFDLRVFDAAYCRRMLHPVLMVGHVDARQRRRQEKVRAVFMDALDRALQEPAPVQQRRSYKRKR